MGIGTGRKWSAAMIAMIGSARVALDPTWLAWPMCGAAWICQ